MIEELPNYTIETLAAAKFFVAFLWVAYSRSGEIPTLFDAYVEVNRRTAKGALTAKEWTSLLGCTRTDLARLAAVLRSSKRGVPIDTDRPGIRRLITEAPTKWSLP